ncbi:MAG: Tol-Pal system beta propeller repeat protein TolB [Myxococcales bacterium]
MRILVTALLTLCLLPALAHAQKVERPVISLSGANFRPLPLAFQPPLYQGEGANRAAGKELDEALVQDLSVSGLFELVDRKAFLADKDEGVVPANIKFNRWLDANAEALVKVVVSGDKVIQADFHLYSVVTGKEELRQTYSAPAEEARRLAHRFADEIFRFYTREPGAFQTKLAFVRKVKGTKQVWTADWDGRNARALTDGRMNLIPAWRPNGAGLAFTSYRNNNPDLFELDLGSGKLSPLFQRPGNLVTGVAFSPDGKRVAFSMSEDDGNSHLWIADASGQNARRLTDGYGINSSPSFSPDSKTIAYVSNRVGTPQIHMIPADGGSPTRLTFQGDYNQTPEWSPRGDYIVFTARDERNVFDLFLLDPATRRVVKRLTQDQGNNEEPTWSPNGRMIAFTSTRSGKSHLYVMSADGNNQRQLTFGEDQVYTPTWGPFPAP